MSDIWDGRTERRMAKDELLIEIREIQSQLMKNNILLSEIHQRQKEWTMPLVEKHERTLYDEKDGLCVRVDRNTTEINSLPKVVAWIGSVVVAVVMILEWLFKWHDKINK